MSYNPNPTVRLADSANLDAFARLRVSEPTLLIDLKRVGGTPDNLATNAVTGTGAAAYTAARASWALTVGAAAGTAIRQTKARAIYQPGKSLLVFQTFILAAGQANLVQRVGYFDTKNGVFLELNGTTVNLVRRTWVTGAPVDNAVAQATWNLDRLDGTGPSGLTLDLTKPQILVADLEWLGVGRVRIGFVIDGIPVYVHQFLNANAALTSVYMSNPNLPLRWEIAATAGITGTASLEAICGQVASEGGYDITGVTTGIDSGTAAKVIGGTTNAEILATRIRSTLREFSTAFVQALTVTTASGADFRWRLVLNPTETGAGAWSDVNTTGSILEQNTTRTVTVNTGLVLASGVVSGVAEQADPQIRPVLTLGEDLAGVGDILSLQLFNLTAGGDDFYATMTLREVY